MSVSEGFLEHWQFGGTLPGEQATTELGFSYSAWVGTVHRQGKAIPVLTILSP